ncbi:hypothetical protein J2Z49_000162 [Desulfofundulus luciae]|uniref:Uncharacterized protein n=1 Tax=Desulfofundulus luciae TaxID=74702 RepID=A0ABU0AX56_9FIRM|nr:hypothetical protein [Desulfofundulus luciae]MDQ0285072.1 hypothetical protein [Desulfofundulus luciae]
MGGNIICPPFLFWDKVALDACKKYWNVYNAYASFNRLVGLWPQDRPVLVDGVNLSFQD